MLFVTGIIGLFVTVIVGPCWSPCHGRWNHAGHWLATGTFGAAAGLHNHWTSSQLRCWRFGCRYCWTVSRQFCRRAGKRNRCSASVIVRPFVPRVISLFATETGVAGLLVTGTSGRVATGSGAAVVNSGFGLLVALFVGTSEQ